MRYPILALFVILYPAVASAEPRTAALPADVAWVNVPRVQVGYQIEGGSDFRAELWVTSDRGRTWNRAAEKESANPIIYGATADGLYGFFIVLFNDAGESSPPPFPNQPPQRWVYVDRAKPAVQLLAAMPDPRFDLNREIYLRWTATDENLPARPVSLHYRLENEGGFQLIADAQAPQSSIRWTVPAQVCGKIEVKVSAVDRAGNRGEYRSQSLLIEGDRPAPVANSQPRPASKGMGAPPLKPVSEKERVRPAILHEPDAGSNPAITSAAKEARSRYDLGTWHRLRGEEAVAIERFREALEVDGTLLAARNDLAGLLLLRGETAEAEQEYRRVLDADGSHRAALKGLAFTLAAKKDYRSSSEALQKYLLLDSKDAEAWLHFGDLMMFTGDRAAAREAWEKATQIEGAQADVRPRAEKRLALYPPRR